MGCCFCKNTKNTNASSSSVCQRNQQRSLDDDLSFILKEEEEEIETLKKVLSSLKHTDIIEDSSVMKIDNELSEETEIFSEVENLSTTSSLPEKKLDNDDDGGGDMKPREKLDSSTSHSNLMRNRSYSNDFTLKRDKVVNRKSPIRRTEASAVERSTDGIGGSQIMTTELRSGSTRGNNNVRRSNSPAGRRSVRKASGSILKRRSSTGRVYLPEKKHNNSIESKRREGSNESFENPLVSLECFIFL